MPARIAMIGSANIDFVMTMPRLPERGETVSGGVFSQLFGGKGANQAVAARRAGGEVAAVASLGDDGMGRDFLALLEAEGVDTANVVLRPGVACGSALIQVEDGGDNTIAIAPGANQLLDPAQVDAAERAIAASDLVMLQMEVPDAAIARTIEICAGRGVEVMLNYAPSRRSDVRLSERQGILVVNETEACALIGCDPRGLDAEKGAATLAENGHRLVVVTLGADGCVTWEAGVALRHPAFAITAVDTTAAGDSFCGALAVGLAEGKPLAEAVRFAQAAGALCAMGRGATPSIPRRDDIERFMRNE